jgi:hypothetical protein
MQARGGLAERSDRLVLVLVATFFADVLGFRPLLVAALVVLAVASTVTVGQRVVGVRRQALAHE